MPAPLYFVPQKTREVLFPRGRPDRARLAEHGLGDLLREVKHVSQIATAEVPGHGPGGMSGLVVCANIGEAKLGYFPTVQRWEPIKESKLWIGESTVHERPGPADLVRVKLIHGYAVELADGNAWNIPIVRRPDPAGSSELPRSLARTREGVFVHKLREEYRQLWEDTALIADVLFSAEATYELEWGHDLAVRALAVNYQVDAHVARLLELIDSQNVNQILEAMIDAPLVNSILLKKKADRAATSTAPGSADS